jgi:hypothetical protein
MHSPADDTNLPPHHESGDLASYWHLLQAKCPGEDIGHVCGVSYQRTVVYCDGAVRLGDWAAAAWLVGVERWQVAAWRSSNPFLAEAKAVELAVRANSGALAVLSDCTGLV